MNKIVDTDVMDIYRLADGVLFKVYKCKVISHIYCDYNKRKCTKLAENVYITKDEIVLRAYGGENIIPAGSAIVENSWVEPITDHKLFRFELKTTGSSFAGGMDRINKFITLIDNIMADYIQ